MKTPEITIKRIYDSKASGDGYRVLVDRLWPRGMKKEDAHLDEWAKDIAPSSELRTAYNHEHDHWKEFKTKYRAELKANEHVATYLDKWEDKKKITLLFASKEPEYSHATVLQDYLSKEYKKRG